MLILVVVHLSFEVSLYFVYLFLPSDGLVKVRCAAQGKGVSTRAAPKKWASDAVGKKVSIIAARRAADSTSAFHAKATTETDAALRKA